MKKLRLILLFALSCSSAALAQSQAWERGFSDQYKSENTLGEYTFGYNEDHTTGGSFRRETSDHMGNKFGSYGLRIGDGRVRIVNYVADHDGFRADVTSNEPGVQSQNSNPHSKITKNSIYSVIIPGFRYSPAIPYIKYESNEDMQKFEINEDMRKFENNEDIRKFERNEDMRDSREEMSRDMGPEIVKDERGFVVDYNYDYPNHDAQGDNFDNYFGDGEENLDEMYSQEFHDPESNYMPDAQMLDDSFMHGEFSHDSETVIRNQTENLQESQTESEMPSTRQADIIDSVTTVAPATQESFTSNHGVNVENRYGSATAGKDEYPLHSNAILSKSKEHVTHSELMNATVSENNVDITKNMTRSSESATA